MLLCQVTRTLNYPEHKTAWNSLTEDLEYPEYSSNKTYLSSLRLKVQSLYYKNKNPQFLKVAPKIRKLKQHILCFLLRNPLSLFRDCNNNWRPDLLVK